MQDSFGMDVVAKMHVAEYDNTPHARQSTILSSLPGGTQPPKVRRCTIPVTPDRSQQRDAGEM